MELFSVVNLELRTALTRDRAEYDNVVHHIASTENIEKQVRALIPIENLRSTGSFFTGDRLAEIAISNLPEPIDRSSICIDPTCGVGNLLLAASKQLPVVDSLDKTILLWSKCLRGFDLHDEFIECTKLRLIYEAISRGARKSKKSLEELETLFKYISKGDIFDHLDSLKKVSHILVNPPYNQKKLPSACIWGSGKVNLAALFMEQLVNNSSAGTSITAILPEVLRSGSRYSIWRDMISNSIEGSVDIHGKFNSRTDVDVINLYGIISVNKVKKKLKWIDTSKGPCVEDYFNICIGPLVSYRDKLEGVEAPFIHSRMLSKWTEVVIDSSFRKTKSKLIKPPFVVINRTSSPSDKNRATATIIKGKLPISVENHLIILEPKKEGVMQCRKLLRVLKSDSTNKYLNGRIRCRHLTVGSVKKIPWKEM